MGDVMTTAAKPKTFMPSAQHRMPAPDEGESPEPKPIQQDDGTTAKTTCEAEEEKTESTANTAEASASNTKRTSQTSTKDVEAGNQDVCEKEVLAKKEKKEKKVEKRKEK